MPKRGFISLVITVAALVLLLNFKTPATAGSLGSLSGHQAIVAPSTAPAAGQAAGGSTGSTGNTESSNATPAPSASATPATGSATTAASYKSGSYTGSAVQIPFGPVQVQVTISGGKITNVNILQYPADRSRSAMISQYALPTLVQETLQAQSANVDLVSGATYTSQGYQQSLQSALDQAHA